MHDENAVDCPPGRASSMYTQRIPASVDRALAHAGVTKAVRAKVQASLSELKFAEGQVVAVSTTKSKRTILVSGPLDGSLYAKFAFPPNTDEFQSELVRAQDTGLTVFVEYREDASGDNVIEDSFVLAGTGTSSPRY